MDWFIQLFERGVDILKRVVALIWEAMIQLVIGLSPILNDVFKKGANVLKWVVAIIWEATKELSRVLFNAANEFTRQHPFLTGIPLICFWGPTFILFLLSIIILVIWIICMGLLRLCGFRQGGIKRGSFAANFQSTRYGAAGIPRGSLFAYMQSFGARYSGTLHLSSVIFIPIRVALGIWGFYILMRQFGFF